MSAIIINKDFLEHEERGVRFTVDGPFSSQQAPLRHEFTDSGFQRTPSVERTRLEQPVILGHFEPLTIDDPRNIYHHPMTVKDFDSLEVGLPESLAFALPAAKAVVDDVRSIYGQDGLKSCQIQLVAQRNDVLPNEAGRKLAKDWHTHTGEADRIDFTYLYSDVLPTEFQTADGSTFTDHHALTRFGETVVHRSQPNVTGIPLRRTFIEFLVIPEYKPQRGIHIKTANNALWTPSENIEAFRRAGEEGINARRFTPLQEPRVLTDTLELAA